MTGRVARLGPAVVAVLGVVLVGLSFAVRSPSPRVTARGGLGPVTTRSRPVSLAAPRSARVAGPRDIDLSLRLRADDLAPRQSPFQTGPAESGLRAEVSDVTSPTHSLVLLSSFGDGSFFVGTLVNEIEPGRTYALHVRVDGGKRITAWVDDRLQFSYSFPERIVVPRVDDVAVGTGFDRTRNFHGDVEGFTLRYANLVVSPASRFPGALRLAGGALIAGALALAIVRLAASRRVLRALVLHELDEPTRARWAGFRDTLRARAVRAGAALIAAGVVVLQLVTPTANVALRRTGERQIGPLVSKPDTSGTYFLAREPLTMESAGARDVRCSFRFRVTSSPPLPDFSPVVVSTRGGDFGFALLRSRSGQLSATIGQRDLPDPLQLDLGEVVPPRRWVDVDLQVLRDRIFVFRIDGRQVRRFVFSRPNLAATPQGVLVGGDAPGVNSFGGEVRDFQLHVTTYQPVDRGAQVAQHVGQLAGALAVLLGVLLVASRALSRFVPTGRVHKPLAVVVLAVTASGIVANYAVNLLRLQRSPYPYFPRNTWLPLPDARFSDYLEVAGIFRSFRPYGAQLGSYPPFGFWLVAPFAWMRDYAGLAAFLATAAALIAWWTWHHLTAGLSLVLRVGLTAAVLLSYPVVFALDRANVDALVFVMVALGVAALEARRRALGAAALGLAAASKILPGFFFVLLVRRRALRFLLVGGLVGLVVTAGALAVFRGDPADNLRGLREGLAQVEHENDDGITSTTSNTSVAGWLQAVAYTVDRDAGAQDVRHALDPFLLPGMLVLGAVLAWWVTSRERSLWRSTTLITAAFLLLPGVSYEYRLIFLLVPLALFLRHAPPTRSTTRIAALFGLLLAPRVYFYVGSWLVSSSVLLTAPLLVVLSVATVADGVSDRRRAARHAGPVERAPELLDPVPAGVVP